MVRGELGGCTRWCWDLRKLSSSPETGCRSTHRRPRHWMKGEIRRYQGCSLRSEAPGHAETLTFAHLLHFRFSISPFRASEVRDIRFANLIPCPSRTFSKRSKVLTKEDLSKEEILCSFMTEKERRCTHDNQDFVRILDATIPNILLKYIVDDPYGLHEFPRSAYE